MGAIQFASGNGNFSVQNPENYSGLYFPVAGEQGIKGCVTPNFGGDIKLNQNAFLMEPVSIENLHNNKAVRNFWCMVEDVGAWSVVGASAEEENNKFTKEQNESELTAGFMWQTVKRQSDKYQLEAKVTSFVPVGHNVEIFQVSICNQAGKEQVITPIAAIPIYGRSADNMRDHRHVTSLLHRIRTTDSGVTVKPTLSFDERGHQKNNVIYYVCGVTGTGEKPEGFYPTVEQFIGEGGSLIRPRMVLENTKPVQEGAYIEGKEALGGIRFARVTLQPGQTVSYTILIGATENETEIKEIVEAYNQQEKVLEAKEATEQYWQNQVNVEYKTGSDSFDGFLRWVSFQPFLRRIYGCSFLPHHDYGRGGRGWRDLWQDCLSLLIMDPSGVRQMILDNYGGVRMDGTNATIIGDGQGEFIADRNGIARVWMDHGVWPFMTTKLYMDQTGDLNILTEKATYFKDEQKFRGTALDKEWNAQYGVRQKKEDGEIYQGTILEHLLLQHLCAFYEVGEHNHMRLRGADWNDALDMASDNGESVAFTCAYAGNFSNLADLLEELAKRENGQEVTLLSEIAILLDAPEQIFEDVEAKKELLQRYLETCGHNVSGQTIQVKTIELADNLRKKAEWLKEHIRKTEWIDGKEGQSEGWFNSYYDNHKQPVEGYHKNGVRMMLTGQVFAVMSNTAKDQQVESICKSADRYLYKKEVGGYRLNTDFHEEKFDMGRAFGFAYGEKENGAVFSHMTVMYANALYQRGFAREGYKALQTLADQALNFETSRIYPGIPEYFDGAGRGLYHYLTGAASWYMLTMVTEVFGVRGKLGNLQLIPRLMKEQFDENGKAAITLNYAGKRFCVTYHNAKQLDFGQYQIGKVTINGMDATNIVEQSAVISRETIHQFDKEWIDIEVTLENK